MVHYLLDTIDSLSVDRTVVVVGRGAEATAKALSSAPGVECAEQLTARGSGDAVAAGLTALADDGYSVDDDASVLVLGGDRPLLGVRSLRGLLRRHERTGAAATALTVEDGPGPRLATNDDGRVVAISEDGDGVVPAGAAAFRRSLLNPAVRRLVPRHGFVDTNIEDVFSVLDDAGHRVETFALRDPVEATPVVDGRSLVRVEAVLRRRINGHWLDRGVAMVDPARTVIDADVRLAPGVRLLPGCMLSGQTVVGADAVLGPDTHLIDCAVGAGAHVVTTTGIDAEIGPRARVGPYAALAAGAQVASDAVTGAFYAADNSDP